MQAAAPFHVKVVSPAGEVLVDQDTSVPPRAGDAQACAEMDALIKENGTAQNLPPEKVRKIIKDWQARTGIPTHAAPEAVLTGAPEPLAPLVRRYAEAVCNLAAGGFEKLPLEKLLDVVPIASLKNQGRECAFDVWLKIIQDVSG